MEWDDYDLRSGDDRQNTQNQVGGGPTDTRGGSAYKAQGKDLYG